ncbi:MAG: MOSC domain-containing protein, partial [Ramlibacter sp.]
MDAIFLRPARLAPVVSVPEVAAEPGRGLVGDRRSLTLRTGDLAQKREVTLFQAEHLPVIAAWLGLPSLHPARLRRNLVVSGINLLSLRSLFRDVRLEWHFGEHVVLEVTGTCEPCSRM